MTRYRQVFGFLLAVAAVSLIAAQAQTPSQNLVIVQAATAATPAPPPPVQEANSISATLKTLQQVKAANQDVLKKQRATLEQLDEMQKAADQLRIFAHRAGG
jgi:hypothetical protein